MNRLWKLFACWACACFAAGPLWAGVVVLQNMTPIKFEFTARGSDGKDVKYTVPPTDIAAIPTDGPATITFGDGANARAYTAALNSIYYLTVRDGKVMLVHLKLPGVPEPTEPPKSEASAQQPQPAQPTPVRQNPLQPGSAQPSDVYKIPVALMVDTNDPKTLAAWEKKFRKRLDDANDIFEHHCHVRFEVVRTGIWQSNPNVHTFDEALQDFAQKVQPHPARVAIGFTSRYDWIREDSHLGATHGALGGHVLVRETMNRISEPERLEVLVHELGHFLGSAHTGDQTSVMRPKLGDQRSTRRSFRIGFDAPNTLVMNLIAQEMRTRHIWHPSMLSPAAKEAVRGAYTVLGQTIPKDPVSTSSLESLGPPPEAKAPPSLASPQLVFGARFIVQALTTAARENAKLPVTSKDPKVQLWRTGDELTIYYVRRAAAAAGQLPRQTAPQSFLLGLGVALDDSNYIHDRPALKEVWDKIDPEDQRATRLLTLGSPTMLKRHDLLGRFTLSAALVALNGAQEAETAGLEREVHDAQVGNGFSFADLCATASGVIFATHVREDNISLADILKNFTVENFMPRLDGLPEDLSWDAYQKQYGEPNSEALQRQRADIFHRIVALPPYGSPLSAKTSNAAAAGTEQKPSTEK